MELNTDSSRGHVINSDKYFSYEWRYKKEDLKFCPRCGSNLSLEDLHIQGQPQLLCHNCHFVFYLDPKLAVVALVEYHNKVLLLQRAEEPGVGLWAFPGGHVERGKDLFETMISEIKEEAGIDASLKSILKTYSLPSAGLVQIVFSGIAHTDKLRVNIESQSAKFFSETEIPWKSLAFETTRECLLEHFGKKDEFTFLKKNNLIPVSSFQQHI